MFVAASLARSRNRVSQTASEELLGSVGVASTDIEPGTPGKIDLFGEIWNAQTSGERIEKGAQTQVTGHDGLLLTVRRK